MSVAWVGAGIAAAGLAANVVGSNQQRKANARAQDQNAALQSEQNAAAWSNYLMSRGIMPTGQVTPGVVPGPGQYTVTNSRLPLWANVNLNQTPTSGGTNAQRQPFLVKRA